MVHVSGVFSLIVLMLALATAVAGTIIYRYTEEAWIWWIFIGAIGLVLVAVFLLDISHERVSSP